VCIVHMAHYISSPKLCSRFESKIKLSSRCYIDYLSDDLLGQIFTRVPSRSTVACKCVSKRWLSLISHSDFIKQFTSHQQSLFKSMLIFVTPRELMLAFWEQSQQNQSLEIPISFPQDMLIKGKGSSICGCSNGLFLCCNNRYTYGSGYYVYDPLVKERIDIPDPSPPLTRIGNLYAVGFVCKPKQKVTARCSNKRNFRVVIIKSFLVRMFEIEVTVFSSKTGRWNHIVMKIPKGFAFAPHWLLSFSYCGKLYFIGRENIFVFDPYSRKRYTINYPSEADAMNVVSCGFLGISGSRLRIADIRQHDLRVWEHVEKNQWDLLHCIDISTKLPQKFCVNYYKRVAGFHPFDGDIVYLHSYADGIFVCYLGTGKFEAVPGYEKADISPFQLEIADSLLPQESRAITID